MSQKSDAEGLSAADILDGTPVTESALLDVYDIILAGTATGMSRLLAMGLSRCLNCFLGVMCQAPHSLLGSRAMARPARTDV